MKIWWVHQYAIPPSESGITRTYDIANAMASENVEISIVASPFNYYCKRRVENAVSGMAQQFGKTEFLWIGGMSDRGGYLRRLASMFDFSVRIAVLRSSKSGGKPDVIIGSSPSPFAALGAYFLACRLRVPYCLEVRDIWPETPMLLGGFSRWNPLIMLMRIIMNVLYKRARLIIAVLPGIREFLAQKNIKTPVFYLPNGINTLELKAPEVLPNKPRIIMYAGSMGLANGVDTLVKSAILVLSSGVDARFEFIGNGPERERLMELVPEKFRNRIKFYPGLPKREIYSRLGVADIFFVTLRNSPLYRWGMSLNKLFDYMAMSKPIVFGGASKDNPVAESGGGIVVPPEDSEAMAESVILLLGKTDQELMEMGRLARIYVERHHDVAVNGAGLLKRIKSELSTADHL